jgi:RNA polymerase sigma-70 factor (ECF subfamily)
MNGTEHRHWHDLDRFQPLLRSYLRQRLRDENDVEDVLQDALLRAARHRAVEGEPRRMHGWLIRVAESAWNDHRRRLRRRPVLEGEPAVLDRFEGREATPGDEPESELLVVMDRAHDRDALFACVSHALRTLRADEQRMLDAFYAGSGCCREVAEVVEAEPARVKSRLYRARRRLSRLVRRQLAASDAPGQPGPEEPAPAPVPVRHAPARGARGAGRGPLVRAGAERAP